VTYFVDIDNISIAFDLSFVLFLPAPPQNGEGPAAPDNILTSLCVPVLHAGGWSHISDN